MDYFFIAFLVLTNLSRKLSETPVHWLSLHLFLNEFREDSRPSKVRKLVLTSKQSFSSCEERKAFPSFSKSATFRIPLEYHSW